MAFKQTYRKTFGPGSLESVELLGGFNEDREHVKIVRGTFVVYCGYGNTHTVTIDSGPIVSNDWESYRDSMSPESRVPFNDESVTALVVNDVIDETWADPCDADEAAMAAGERSFELAHRNEV